MAMIYTKNGEVDEATLIKRMDSLDNANETTTATEYCVVGCTGPAHVSGVPDSAMHFCDQHVRRDVNMVLKPAAAESVAASF